LNKKKYDNNNNNNNQETRTEPSQVNEDQNVTIASPDNVSSSPWLHFDINNEVELKKSPKPMPIEIDDDFIVEYTTMDPDILTETEDFTLEKDVSTTSTAQLYTQDDSRIATSTVQSQKRKTKGRKIDGIRFPCPLTTRSFGIRQSHCHSGVLNLPCPRSPNEPRVIYWHLRAFHSLSHAAAMKIIRVISSPDDNGIDIDLFSTSLPAMIVTNLPANVRGHCPLTKMGVFGLSPSHNVDLCNVAFTTDVKLHRHFVKVHDISNGIATRICRAIIENKSQKISLFKPNELIRRKKSLKTTSPITIR